MMKSKILVFLVLLITLSVSVAAVEKDALSLFYSHQCSHCHEEMEWLDSIHDNCSIEINYYRISKTEDKDNQELFREYLESYNASYGGVPVTFINNKVFLGFAKGEGDLVHDPKTNTYVGYENLIVEEMQSLAQKQGIECNIGNENNNAKNPVRPYYSFIIVFLYLLTYFIFKNKIENNNQSKRYWISGLVASFIISFFVFILLVPESLITSFAENLPFPLFVGVLAIADGFNPCAFTVLFILLSLLTYTKSKKQMNLVGMIFIITSAVMYFVFIMIMVLVGSLFIEKYGTLILNILGVIVLGAGIINLKDYIFFKKGVSLSISDKQKKKITKKARKIVKSLEKGTNMLYALGATVLLAITVNLVELGCTAILPTVYMAALNTNYAEIGLMHFVWTAMYAFIYVIPLFAILANFVFTFRSERISEDQGRVLKLVAGVFMVVCGTVMVLKPSLLMLG